MGPATGLSCPHSLVADGPLEPDALLALEEALRVQLGLDRLEPRETVRAPDVLLQGDALLFAFRVRKTRGTKRRWPSALITGRLVNCASGPTAFVFDSLARFFGRIYCLVVARRETKRASGL